MPGDDLRDALKQQNGEQLVHEAVANAKPWKPDGGKQIELTTMRDIAAEQLEVRRRGPLPRIGTGIPKLDKVLEGGFEFATFVLLAALSSHGKTAFALQTCHYIITQLKYAVVFVSIEMSKAQLADRTFSHVSSAPKDRWHELIERLETDTQRHFSDAAEFYVVDKIITLDDVEAAIRQAFEKGAKVAFVDYAGKISTGDRDDQNSAMQKVSARLNALAKEYDAIVICLGQLNKRVANRENLSPQMHDVQYGTNLVNDADYVLFNIWPHKVDKSNPFEDYLVIVAKNRNGQTDVGIKCKFNAPRQKITEAFPEYQPEPQPDRQEELKGWDDWNQQSEGGFYQEGE